MPVWEDHVRNMNSTESSRELIVARLINEMHSYRFDVVSE